jgi:hypothetical protein
VTKLAKKFVWNKFVGLVEGVRDKRGRGGEEEAWEREAGSRREERRGEKAGKKKVTYRK